MALYRWKCRTADSLKTFSHGIRRRAENDNCLSKWHRTKALEDFYLLWTKGFINKSALLKQNSKWLRQFTLFCSCLAQALTRTQSVTKGPTCLQCTAGWRQDHFFGRGSSLPCRSRIVFFTRVQPAVQSDDDDDDGVIAYLFFRVF